MPAWRLSAAFCTGTASARCLAGCCRTCAGGTCIHGQFYGTRTLQAMHVLLPFPRASDEARRSITVESCHSPQTERCLRTQSGRNRPTVRSLRTSAPRIALSVWLVVAGGSHHRRQGREMSSPRTGRDRWGISPVSFSHSSIRWKHGTSRQRCMWSWLRAVRVLPGNAAKAARPFFRDRYFCLWRPLQPRRRCADRERSGPRMLQSCPSLG